MLYLPSQDLNLVQVADVQSAIAPSTAVASLTNSPSAIS